MFFLGLRPGLFLEMFLFTLRALLSLGLRPGPFFEKGFFCPPGGVFSWAMRPGLFFPSGILPPAGNFLLAQKVPQKRLPPVALRGLRLTRNPLGAFLLRAHQRGSRGRVQNLGCVSSAI